MIITRPVNAEDFQAISNIYGYYVNNTAATFEIDPPSKEELLNRWQQHVEMPFIVAIEDNEVRGYAYIRPYHHRCAYRLTAENSLYVDPEHLGKGIGNKLMEALLNSSKVYGIKQLIARIAIWQGSDASINLHK